MAQHELTTREILERASIELGESAWVQIDQDRIDTFADARGDHQWIQVDPERARNGPFKTTIAHGYLLLSLLPAMFEELLEISDQEMGVNYGTERVRFTSPVPVGSRVRLRAAIKEAAQRNGAVQWRVDAQVQIEGSNRPALVGEVAYLSYPKS